MTEISKKVYKDNIIDALKELSDRQYQKDIWLNQNNPKQWIGTFGEAINILFDDCVVGDYLKEGEIIIDEKVTQALRELDDAVDAVLATEAVDEFREEDEIFDDPRMEIVRQKAARALFLVQTSRGDGSTVRILNAGQE